MSSKQVPRITCDLCLRFSIEDEGVVFFGYQGVDICQSCCFVLRRSEMFSEDIVYTILEDYGKASLKER